MGWVFHDIKDLTDDLTRLRHHTHAQKFAEKKFAFFEVRSPIFVDSQLQANEFFSGINVFYLGKLDNPS